MELEDTKQNFVRQFSTSQRQNTICTKRVALFFCDTKLVQLISLVVPSSTRAPPFSLTKTRNIIGVQTMDLFVDNDDADDAATRRRRLLLILLIRKKRKLKF